MKLLALADLHLDRYFARRMDPFQVIPEDRLRDVAAAHDATFVQKSELIFGRQRLLCCTLWTDFDIYGERSDNLRNAVTQKNDYLDIRVAKAGFKKLTPVQTVQIHLDHKQWLARRLSEKFDGETTVITHHAPHTKALKDMSDIGPCYASNLEPLILKHQPDRWLFGHTHHRLSFNIGQTRLTNVSVGYPDELDPNQNLERFIFDLEG